MFIIVLCVFILRNMLTLALAWPLSKLTVLLHFLLTSVTQVFTVESPTSVTQKSCCCWMLISMTQTVDGWSLRTPAAQVKRVLQLRARLGLFGWKAWCVTDHMRISQRGQEMLFPLSSSLTWFMGAESGELHLSAHIPLSCFGADQVIFSDHSLVFLFCSEMTAGSTGPAHSVNT